MEERVLTASSRTDFGKAAAAKCRKADRLPAVIYDRNGRSTAIDVPYRDFAKLFKTVTESTLITIKVDGKDDYEVFIKDYQYDIVSDKVFHADFYAVERGQVLRTKIQIRLTGSPEACRQGAVLETGITEVEVECLPRNLPERIVIDVSTLGANESFHVRDIKVPEGVKILTDADLAVAMVKFTRDVSSAADTAEASEDAAAEVKA
ncbi:MAG: 50S ribosomal protein L25 [Treponema sp.]|uniref:50S ribosomal protein L25 n=1 Tax=Treponema sp. TaxID=166 RepID=UPI003FA32FA4